VNDIKKYSLTFAILILGFRVLAQNKEITHQNLYWARYYSQLIFTEKISWHNEIDNRTFFENNRHHHLIIHSRLHYKIFKNADAALGLTYSLQSPQDPNSISNLIVPEIRPNQEFNYLIPIDKRLTIHHRFRLDERFFRKNNGIELNDGYDFNFRLRYRLQISYKIGPIESSKPTTLKMANELMVNAGKTIVNNHFDQNRVYFAIEQTFSKQIAIEVGYLKWYQQRATGYQYFDRNIIRFTMYHKMML
jgi:hypothetical protein